MTWRYPGNDPENGPAYNDEARDKYGNLKYDEHGNRVYHRKDGKTYWGPNWRRDKRQDLKMMENSCPPVQEAYYRGMEDGEYRAYRNPYPAGKRHDEYQRGFVNSCDKGDYYR